MIETTEEDAVTGKYARVLTVFLLTMLLQGCTNSKLIIGPLYNRLDDRMRDRFQELAEFDTQQVQAFEARLGNYHVWHRQSELPEYASLMKTIAASIAAADTSAEDVRRWFSVAERHSLLLRQCHPVNFLTGLMQSLSDEQINEIEQHLKEERRENSERYKGRTQEERIDRRMKNVSKWARRINLELTDTQRALLLDAFAQQISLRQEYRSLTEQWRSRFFALLRDRDNPDYANNVNAHLDRLWRLLETEHPDDWQYNRELWLQTSLQLIQSLTSEQRRTASRWMNRMASTLDAVSRDEPSFSYVNDASLGCLIDPEKT